MDSIHIIVFIIEINLPDEILGIVTSEKIMAGRESVRGQCWTKVSHLNKSIETDTFEENNVVFTRWGFSYRAIVLRALPNLEMLDNVGVTQEELNEALKAGVAQQREEDVYEDAYTNGPPQQQQQAYQQQSPNREVSIRQTRFRD